MRFAGFLRPDSRNIGIPRMDLDMEETHETHNLYIECTYGRILLFMVLLFIVNELSYQ